MNNIYKKNSVYPSIKNKLIKKSSALQNDKISVVFIVAASVSQCLEIWYIHVFQNFSGMLVQKINYVWIPVNELGCFFIVLGVFYI